MGAERIADDPTALAIAIGSARTVRFYDGGMLDDRPLAPDPALTVTGDDVRQVLSLIAVEAVTDGLCMCLGDPALEFLADDGQVLATVGLHHGRSLRWSGWAGDAVLEDGPTLVAWLDARGLAEPLREHQRQERARSERDDELARWQRAAPPGVEDLLPGLLAAGQAGVALVELLDQLEDRLTQVLPDELSCCRALLAWFAAGSGRCSGFPTHEQIPGDLVGRRTVADVLSALDGRTRGDAVWQGVLRHLAGWRSRTHRELLHVPPGVWRELVSLAGTLDDADKHQRILRTSSTYL